MFFIGSTDHRGTYYFHSQQHNGWVVADLDTGKATLHNTLAFVRVLNPEYADVVPVLEKRAGLGQDGDRWLVDGDELVPLLRKYSEEIEVLTINNQDGTQRPYGKAEVEIAKMVREAEKKAKRMK